MARVFKCDICGEYYPYPKGYDEINRITFRQVNHSTQHELRYFDICPDCVKAFEKFVEEREKKGGNDGTADN